MMQLDDPLEGNSRNEVDHLNHNGNNWQVVMKQEEDQDGANSVAVTGHNGESFQFDHLSGAQQDLVAELKAQVDDLQSVLNKQRALLKYNQRFYSRLRCQVIHNPDDPLGSIIHDLDRYRVIRRRINRQFAHAPPQIAVDTNKRDLYEVLFDLTSTLASNELSSTTTTAIKAKTSTGRPRGRPPGRGRGRPTRTYQLAMFTPEVELLTDSSSPSTVDTAGSTRIRKSKLAAGARLQSINAALNSVPDERKRKKSPRKLTINTKPTTGKPRAEPMPLSPEMLAKVEERIRKKTAAASWAAVNDPNAGILGRPSKAKDALPKPKKERPPPLDVKPIYVCNIGACQYETLVEADIKEHQRGHQEVAPFACHTCGAMFDDRPTYKDHRLIYHNLTDVLYKCSWPQCSFVKCFLERLKMHYKSHVAQPTIKCIWPGCEKMFRFKGNLQEHMRMHENERLFKCNHCTYSCNTSCNLRKHVILHERKKETEVANFRGGLPRITSDLSSSGMSLHAYSSSSSTSNSAVFDPPSVISSSHSSHNSMSSSPVVNTPSSIFFQPTSVVGDNGNSMHQYFHDLLH